MSINANATTRPAIRRSLATRHPPKRIRLTIEWRGACSEDRWAEILSKLIEECDHSCTTRVIKRERLTEYGTTPRLPERDLRALGYKPRRRSSPFWLRLRHKLARRLVGYPNREMLDPARSRRAP